MGIFPRWKPKLKKMCTLFVFMISLCLFSGCNSQLADLSPIRYAPFHLETSGLGAFTRVIIYMTSADGSESFAKFYTSAPVIDMEVPIGNYHFYGISYNGNNVSQCSIVENKSISGIQNPVTLNFQATTCAEEIFIGPSSALNLGTGAAPAFTTTKLEWCETVAGISSSSNRCTDDMTDPLRIQARGHVSSYRWILAGFNKTRGVSSLSGEEWASACQVGTPTPNSLGGLSSTQMGFNVPAGDGSLTPFHLRLELWPGNTGCTQGEPFYLDLPFGLLSDSNRSKYVVDPTGPTHKLYVRANGEDICKGLNFTPEFAGGSGNFESPKLICDERQLYNIFPSTVNATLYESYARFNYKLLADIDLSDNLLTGSGFSPPWENCVGAGSNFMPIGTTFGGTCSSTSLPSVVFDGGGKTIKGLRIVNGTSLIAFYREISAGARVQRLTFENPFISGAGNVGVVVGQSYNSHFKQIQLINPVVIGTAGFVASAVGSSHGGSFSRLYVQNTSINGSGVVGGVIGRALYSGSSTVTLNKLFVTGSMTGANQVGGIVGSYGSSTYNSVASELVFKGTIRGSSSQLGGIFGVAYSTRITDSYARVHLVSNFNSSIVTMGGLVGSMMSKVAGGPSGIYHSYVLNTRSHSCSPVSTSCAIGTVVGSHDGSFAATDFDTVVYDASSHIALTNFVRGTQQTDASFLSLTPNWDNAGVDLMPLFPATMWEFYNGDYPRLVSEPR